MRRRAIGVAYSLASGLALLLAARVPADGPPEALEKWGKENVLRDVVRVIRMDRPFVLISRFQGNARDGHGNHQTAGLITQEAFQAAGDPGAFPEQIAQGLRPWPPLKVYIGGVREE